MADNDERESGAGPLVVCLGYPDMQAPHYRERLHALSPRVETVCLPVDPDTDWVRVPPALPHPEPPAWAAGCAQERRESLARAHVLCALHTPDALMERAPGLRWVQGLGAGVDQFVKAGVPADGVVVTNASGLGAPSMAEFVIGRLLQIWKRFPEIDALHAKREYRQRYGRTFRGSTIGIVGLGHIGRAVAIRARAFGTRVLGMRRSEPSDEDRACTDACYRPTELHTMLAQCDAIVVCAPETSETHHLIDAAALAALPAGAVVVNVARGALVDEAALLGALRSGHVAAAALDVFEQEPLPPESPMWAAPNLLGSAHCSVSTDRYIEDAFELFEDNLARYLRGQALRNRVDPRALGFEPA